MQQAIGGDIMMALDQCIPSTAPTLTRKRPWISRTAGPSARCAPEATLGQALFGIVQGACHPDLRKKSAAFLSEQPFDGFAIGGLAVGETHA